jgi:hypothetical protein
MISLSTRLQDIEKKLSLSYVIDPVGLPDFAQWSAGARIILPYTTGTTRKQRMKNERLFFASVFSTPDIPAMRYSEEWRGPEMAITPVLGLGDCWPIRGRSGSLGISLARTIQPKSITVEHVPRQLAFDLTSAPRDIEVWNIAEHDSPGPVGNGYLIDIQTSDIRAEGVLSKEAILLARFTYNIYASEHIQTFEVLPHIAHSDVRTKIILFIIRNNWGNEDFTCLYRVRVHGHINV